MNRRRVVLLGTLLLCAHISTGTKAHALTPEAQVMGGTVMSWDAPGEAGNAFGLSLGLRWDTWRLGLAFATILPDSRSDAMIHAFFLEANWEPFGLLGPVAPYMALGAGAVTADALADSKTDDFDPVRWNEDGADLLVIVALGARFGSTEGLFVTADLRLYNISHAGIALSAGFIF